MAGSESYDARAMGDDELIVESLDGRAYLPLRARVAAAWHRLRRARRPAWLTRQRMGCAALGLALLAVFALSVTGLAGQWWNAGRLAVLWHFAPTYTRTTIHAGVPGTLAAVVPGWQHIPLPPTGDRMDALVTSPTDPQAALACAGPQSDPKTLEMKDGPITLWHTRDGGQHWQRVGIPTVTGTYCIARVAEGAPQRLALVVNGAGGCQTNHALFSTDGGQHWRVLSPPPSPPQPAKMQSCALEVAVTPHYVYASVGITVLASITTTRTSNGNSISTGTTYNYQTTTLSTRSDDDGRTWTTLSENMPQVTNPVRNIFSADGQTIMQAGGFIQNGNSPSFNTRFWVSRDAGESWQPQGSLSGFFTTELRAAPGVTLENATAGKPVYALSGTGSPWYLARIQIAQLSGRTWAPLPPLPVGGASAEHMGVTFALTATPNGKLLALGLGPRTTIPRDNVIETAKQAAEWLWEWDPVAARWSAIMPIPPDTWPSRCVDHCWRGEIAQGAGPQGSGTYLWLTSSDSASATPTVLRVRLPEK